MRALSFLVVCVLVTAAVEHSSAEEPLAPFDALEFARLHALIQPCPGESPWREIDWLTNITEARRQAAAQDKPIVIFTAADGSPLGRT